MKKGKAIQLPPWMSDDKAKDKKAPQKTVKKPMKKKKGKC